MPLHLKLSWITLKLTKQFQASLNKRVKLYWLITKPAKLLNMFATVCSFHVTYAFQSESTLYICLNVKELLAQRRREIWSLSDSNGTRTHNNLVRKRTLNHLWVFVYELSGCGFKSRCGHMFAALFDPAFNGRKIKRQKFLCIPNTDQEQMFAFLSTTRFWNWIEFYCCLIAVEYLMQGIQTVKAIFMVRSSF